MSVSNAHAKPPGSIRQRMAQLRVRVVALFLLALLPSLFAVWHVSSDLRDAHIGGEKERLNLVMQSVVAREKEAIGDAHQFLNAMRLLPEALHPADANCSARLTALLGQEQRISNLTLSRPDGRVFCSARGSIGVNIGDRTGHIEALKRDETVLGDVTTSRITGKLVIPFYRAIRAGGKVVAMATASVDISWISQELRKASPSPNARIGVIDSTGILLTRVPDPEGLVGRNLVQNQMVKAIDGLGDSGSVIMPGLDGVSRVIAFSHFADLDTKRLFVWSSVPLDEITANSNQQMLQVLALSALALAITFALLWFGSRELFIRPLSLLESTAARLAAGDLNARSGIAHDGTEIGEVARSMDLMADSLRGMQDTVRANLALKALLAEKNLHDQSRDEIGALKGLCEAIVAAGDYHAACVGYAEDDAQKSVRIVASCGLDAEFLANADISWGDGSAGKGPMARAIRSGEPVVVNDIQAGPATDKWQDFATQREARSVLGLPLLIDERVAGGLLLYSKLPDAFGKVEVEVLNEIALDVGVSIAAIRERAARRQAEIRAETGGAQLAEAQRIARLGSWELDLLNDRFTASDEMFRMAGIAREDLGTDTAAMTRLIHPDDLERATGIFREAVAGKADFQSTHRILCGDGSVKVVEAIGRTTFGKDGKPERILGTWRDITEEQALRITVRERMKELRCLYEVFRITDQQELPMEALLAAAAAALPPGWLHDGDAAARIRFGDIDAATSGFAETAWMLTAIFQAAGSRGEIRVAYAHAHDAADEGPFLKEERTLIDAIAMRISETIDRRVSRDKQLEREEIFSTIVGQAHDAITLLDPESGTFVEFNETAHSSLGYTREEFARMRMADITIAPAEMIRANNERMLQPGGAVVEARFRHRDGSISDVLMRGRAVTLRGRRLLSAIISDVTESRRMEKALSRSNREVRAVSEAMRHVVFAQSESELLDNICREIVTAGGYATAWVGRAENDAEKSVRPIARSGDKSNYIDEIRISWGDDALGQGPAGTAIRKRRPAIVRNAEKDPTFAPWADAARRHGLASSLSIPLLIGEEHAEAVLMVYSYQTDAFDDAEVELLIGLVNSISFGISALRERERRTHAQNDAAAANERLVRLVEASPVVVYTLRNQDGRFVPGEVSDNIERLLGYSAAEVQDPDWWFQHAHPDDREKAMAAPYEVQGQSLVVRDYRFQHRDGRYIWVHDTLRVLREEDGEAVELVGAWSDVTERHQADEELRKLSMAVEQSVEIIIITDLDGTIEYVNEAFVHHTGYTRDEVIGRNPRLLKSGKTPPGEYAAMWRALLRGMPWSGEFINRRKDGTEIIEAAFISPLRQADGRVTHFVAVKQNITERRAMDAELRKLSMAVEQSPESIAITNLEARLEYVNEAFLSSTGYSREEVIGQNPRLLQSGKTPKATYDEMWAALSAGKSWKGEFVNKRKDGNEYVELAIIAPVRGADGQTTHYLAIKDDISDRKRMGAELDNYRRHLEDLVKSRTAELVEARERADAANVAKSAFLANMSHEIRTPMNAIIGLTHLVRHTSPTPEQDERLVKIEASARHLLVLINDILDLSTVEAGKMAVEHLDFDPARVMNESFAILRTRADDKHVAISMEIDPSVPASVNGDPLRLRQILINLGSNAVKFTERGSVTLRVRMIGADAERVMLRFEVQDTGIGLSDEQRGRLFYAFEQADTSTTRKFGGSGLGLAISQRLAGLMGGVIDVESTLGQGSLFTLTVPFDRNTGRAALPAGGIAPGSLAGRRALIAHHDAGTRHSLRLELEESGLRVEEFDTADSAYRAAHDSALRVDAAEFLLAEWRSDQPAAVNGEAAVEILHTVALLAADARPLTSDLQRAGFVASLCLPLQKNALTAVLADLLTVDHGGSHLRWQGTADAAARGAVRVLLVDDDDINQEVGRELLEDRGFKVDVAGDGAAALAAAAHTAYDLVLMDIQMPVMDGLQATREMRRMTGYGHGTTPILAMTANAFEEDRQKALAAGMNDFITKPVDPQRLFDTLARWLPAMPVQRTDHGSEVSPQERISTTERLAGIEGLDVNAGLAVFQGHEAAYEHVLGMFMQRRAEDAASIREQLASGQRDAALRIAHTLKGTAASIGAHALRDLATQVEQAIGEGRPPRDLDTLITTLEAASRALTARLESRFPAAPGGEHGEGATEIDWGAARALLKRIADLLAEDDVRATKAWQADSLLLRKVLGEAAAGIEKRIASFEYDRALAELRQATSSIPQLGH
jgi:PAS domain S-box-containing protein